MGANRKTKISEELLAAFDEGRTSAEETQQVLEGLAHDEDLQEEYMLSRQLDAVMGLDMEEPETLPMTALAAESEGNLCDLQCEQYILRQRGISFDTSTLTEEALNNRWLREKGTPLHSIGRLLEQRDLIVLRRFGAEVSDILRAIKASHDVIVVVNNNKLNGDESSKISYHAVVVLSVDDSEVRLYNPAAGDTPVTYPLDRFEAAWKDVQSYLVRVKGKDFDYNPQPLNLDDVMLSSDLVDLREAIAENAHEVWADIRQEEGWSYGPERNDAERKHPDMVPYAMLSESEKEYDRRMAFDTIKLMKKLGYDLIKRRDDPGYRELIRRLNSEEPTHTCDCGAAIFLGQIYCFHCGKRLDWKKFL